MLFLLYFFFFFFFNFFFFLFFLSFFKKNKELLLSSKVICKLSATKTNTLEFTYLSVSDVMVVRQWLYILHSIYYRHSFIITPVNTYSVVTRQGNSIFLSNSQNTIFCSTEQVMKNLFKINSSAEDFSFFTEEGKYSPEFIQCSDLLFYQDIYTFLPLTFGESAPACTISDLFKGLDCELSLIFSLEKKQNKSLIFLRKLICSTPFFFLNITFVRSIYRQFFFLIVFFLYKK